MDGQPPENFLRAGDLLFPKDRAVLSPAIRRALRQGTYEEREANAVQRQVTPDDIVMELGAGIGFMSTLAAKTCGAREVHTYEGNPALIPFIRRVHAANGVEHVVVNNALLGREAGSAKFYARENILASSMDPDPTGIGTKPATVHDIEVRPIADEMARIKPTVLICDIEGGEADLIPAADLSTVRVAVVELHPRQIGETGTRDVFKAMMDAGLTYLPWPSNRKVVVFKKGW